MAILAVGGEADCWYPVSGQAFNFESAVGRYEATASRHAMKIVAAVSEIEMNFPANITTGWIHMYIYQEAIGDVVTDFIQIKTKAGLPAFRIGIDATGLWSIYKYSGAAWTSALGTTVAPVAINSLATIDILLTVGVSGTFKIFKDGVAVITFIGDTTIDNTNFGRLHIKGQPTSTKAINVSQVVIADESTLGFKLITQTPTSAGATSGWTGDYTMIDDTTYDINDFIETNVTNAISTFGTSNINAAYSTYNVKAVTVAMQSSNDAGSAVSDLQAAVRVGASNFFSANLGLTKDGSNYPVQGTFNLNPATAAVWTQAEVNAAEAGVKTV
jgi:energy-converting hydrogenase Eha subunit E